MNIYNTVIIDDEINARNILKEELNEFSQINIIAEFDSLLTGVIGIDLNKPDLVFLDINLGDGTAFDLLEKITFKGFKIVFVTAYDKFAINAFKYNAIDYLLKPVFIDDLRKTIEKLQPINQNNNLEYIIKNINAINSKKLPIHCSDGILFFEIEQIIHLQADGNYTFIYTKSEKILSSKTLKEYEDILEGIGFERVHNSHLVNIKQIKKYINKDGGYLVMIDNTTVPISQRKKSTILKIFDNLI